MKITFIATLCISLIVNVAVSGHVSMTIKLN